MCKKRGFTLVEVLFVVVIAAGILAFAVPAYKRAQERADYEAALGVLLDVSNAVESLTRDLNRASENYNLDKEVPFPKKSDFWHVGPVDFSSTMGNFGVIPGQPGSWDGYLVNKYSDTRFSWDKHFEYALLNFGYLKGTLENTKEYDLYILKKGTTPSGDVAACATETIPAGTRLVACMLKEGTKNDCYKGARVFSDGSMQRIKGTACAD